MKPLKLTVVGCGDAFGSGGRLNTCFHVESETCNFLIDCGASVLPGLKKCDLDPGLIDLIFITHFHGDHFGGLPFLLVEASLYKRNTPLSIISPPGCREKVSELINLLYPGNFALEKLDIRFIEYQPFETIMVKNIQLSVFPVIHVEASLPHGLRITLDDRTISYSGDTEWTDNLLTLADDADLFICECNFYEKQVKCHLNYKMLESKISEFGCRKILLTHFDTEMLGAISKINLDCARDGMVLVI
ncbi:MBL fold metallo-hydrolase [Flavihumibacter sp. R14]|nr:MBL fold metallo-hydrolase [Flavihumibacter soli]